MLKADPKPSLLILGSLAISGAFESEVEMSVLEELEVSEKNANLRLYNKIVLFTFYDFSTITLFSFMGSVLDYDAKGRELISKVILTESQNYKFIYLQ